MKTGRLLLIPTFLAPGALDSLSPQVIEAVKSTSFFFAEKAKTARRFIKVANPEVDFDSLTFCELNKRTSSSEIDRFLMHAFEGHDIGVISEAGVPAVADPGKDLVFRCHEQGIEVVPLVGPSSIILALMASGLNGQQFRFNGYLPIPSNERKKAIKQFERNISQSGETQIFIETPYRNVALFEDMLSSCAPTTRLCLAIELTAPNAEITTLAIQDWKKMSKPNIHKRPAVFLLGK